MCFSLLLATLIIMVIACMLMTSCGKNNAREQEASKESRPQEKTEADTLGEEQQASEGNKNAAADLKTDDNSKVIVNTAFTGTIEMNYLRFGDGRKTLVILPGLSIKPVTLSAQAVAQGFADFTEEYTVYLFDRRTNIPDTYSIGEMAEDTATVMRALGIEHADIFGASQGGMIAMNIAIEYPELVNRMVLGSTAAGTNENLLSVISDWISLAGSKDGYELNAAVCRKIYSEAVYNAYKDVLLSAGNEISAEELDRFVILASSIVNLNLYDELDKITCEVLVLGSEGDRVTTAAASKEIAEKLGCESYFYDDSYGHAVYDEAPDFRGRMLEFFNT